MSLLNKYELARELGIAVRSVERYQQRGCPFSHDDENRTVFDLEAVERWLEAEGVVVRPEPPAPPPAPRPAFSDGAAPVSKDSLQRAKLARDLSVARKNELEINAEKGLKELGLDQKIRGAKTLTQLAEVCAEFAAFVSSGTIQPQRSHALRQTLGLLEKAIRSKEAETKTDGRMWLCTEQAFRMAEVFDKIGNGWRRQWLLDAARAHLDQDMIELPGFEVDMTECLAALRIDLMGEPAGERPEYMTPPQVPLALPPPPEVANPPRPTC